MKKVFLSHIVEEAKTADALKRSLESAVEGVELFASPVDVGLGEQRLKTVETALQQAGVIIVLCSRRSIARRLINFEAGAGWGRNILVIPVCHGGLGVQDLPDPLRQLQSVVLDRANECQQLATRLAMKLGLCYCLRVLEQRLRFPPPEMTATESAPPFRMCCGESGRLSPKRIPGTKAARLASNSPPSRLAWEVSRIKLPVSPC